MLDPFVDLMYLGFGSISIALLIGVSTTRGVLHILFGGVLFIGGMVLLFDGNVSIDNEVSKIINDIDPEGSGLPGWLETVGRKDLDVLAPDARAISLIRRDDGSAIACIRFNDGTRGAKRIDAEGLPTISTHTLMQQCEEKTHSPDESRFHFSHGRHRV